MSAETTERFLFIPTDQAEKSRLRAEKARLRRARYEDKNPGRDHGKATGHQGGGPPSLAEREFIVWDGEGPRDTGYSLFGNSKGHEICKPSLRTRDCFKLLLDTARRYPYGIHVIFGGNYDVSNWIESLPWRCMAALYKYNRTVWKDYEIEHIPRKWFKLTKGKTSIKIYDIQSFFATSLVGALEEWSIGPFSKIADVFSIPAETALDTGKVRSVIPDVSELETLSEPEMVVLFKTLRSEFQWKDIEQIRLYMRLELKYTKILMENLRQTFLDAGYLPRSWHGPGALARMAINRHHVYDAMAECPVDVRIASRYAFIGGRFELVKAGYFPRTIYSADINSAYPYYATQLPNLAKGHWRRGNKYEHGRFGVYHIRYTAKPDPYKVYPLPFRDRHGMVVWPHRVEGWYWGPEAQLVSDNPDATFVESWIFEEDDPADKPFAWIGEYYHRRQLLKRIGNPAEFVFKLIINSIYGQLAQRTGWDRKHRKAPRTHQLEWAGWITSACRAAIWRKAQEQGEDLISFDTDGVYGLRPFSDLESGTKLGEWKLEEYEEGIFWQSGIYNLKEKGEWKKAKTRGIPKGKYSVEELFTCLRDGTPLSMTKKVFISYGLALQGKKRDINSWTTEPHKVQFGGGGKRYHHGGTACQHHCESTWHRLTLPTILYGPFTHVHSYPHYLPWIDEKGMTPEKKLMQDLTLFDTNDATDVWEWDNELDLQRG
jgi:hypothetical protein